ncbi:Putative MFS transporter superfamily [Septoria linicola]|uniref:MFS transporter superfamily n=1 Tax=Septoria linicola TaxID=215465 RepID=A0A9Q9EQR3_9PEZI|nr:putative MFS transporter superfamily [Septoria linicola]USW59087.1 Putative MFS transporter superfamily [Septoria linicola]
MGREELSNEKPSPDSSSFAIFLDGTIFRPLYFYLTEPIVTTVVSIGTIAWSLLFIFTESITVVFELLGFTETQTSLFFIPILIGIFLGAPVRFRDLQSMRRRRLRQEQAEPEDRLFSFALAAPALALGLWWFGWTSPQAVHIHWIVPSIALAIIGLVINELQYVLAGYLTDCCGSHAASAVGALACIRGSAATTFSLFAYFMFTGISTNAASSILASVATVFCIAPVIFIKYGAKLRRKSKRAVSS